VPESIPTITVLAGTNGAGKSSIGGALLKSAGTSFYNPDTETRALMVANPGMSLGEANSQAWRIGKERLEAAIAHRINFNFETTLGGATIARLLAAASDAGLRVRIWYCGLAGADLHIQRVRARVRSGGHDIPDAKIRERYDSSRNNLCTLLPVLYELLLFDNSAEADPQAGNQPQPVKLLHYLKGQITYIARLAPEWAKPIAAVVMSESSKRAIEHQDASENPKTQ
jgi:predicted ABC-type ATPase